jgi:Arc/MetJ family transcription regulator
VRTNIVIDDKLICDALRATGLQTLVRLNKQAEIRRLRSKTEWQGDLDAMRIDR